MICKKGYTNSYAYTMTIVTILYYESQFSSTYLLCTFRRNNHSILISYITLGLKRKTKTMYLYLFM